MKRIGIWLDKEKAHIVTLKHDGETLTTIASDIEHYKIHGGSGTRLKGGPQDVVQDSKYLEREKHQMKVYFKKVISYIEDADAIAIFGPAETFEKLNKTIRKHYTPLYNKVKTVQRADSMTLNQIKALVRDFYTGS